MTIDNNLLKQAIQLQKQVGREPWMDDLQTIKAMRLNKVDWGIIYKLVSQKHNLGMTQDEFEKKASGMIRSASATASKRRKQSRRSEGASSEHRVSIEGDASEVRVNSVVRTKMQTNEDEIELGSSNTPDSDFEDLNKNNPLA